MTAQLNIGQLQGISPTNEITIPSDTKLFVDGTLRVNTIQNLNGIQVLTSTGSNVTLSANLTVDATISAVNITPTSRLVLPTWTTSTRPTTNLVNGLMGLNTDTSRVEAYNLVNGWADVRA